MTPRLNEYGQPIGPSLPDWSPREAPPRSTASGRYSRVEPVDAGRHLADLWEAVSAAPDGSDWTYMSSGPFPDFEGYSKHVERITGSTDPFHHAIIDLASGKAVGTAALMRIDPAVGVVEVGHVAYSRRLKRSAVATEAMFLLMKRVFDELGYRRYEWKCDSLNAPSRAAALRYGFEYEGIFRNATVYKGHSRDTAWFAMTDGDWPAIRRGYERWLRPENFGSGGMQVEKLADSIEMARAESK